jgi:plasmid stability protein
MPTVYIRDLPLPVYRRLKERASQNRRSITREAALILEEALTKPRAAADAWTTVDALRDRLRARYGRFDDSTHLIRRDRRR